MQAGARRGLTCIRRGKNRVGFDSPGLRLLLRKVGTMAKTLKFHGAEKVRREVAKRWTPQLIEDGWTPVSDFFLRNYHRLSPPITNSEAILVIHLMSHKWDHQAPYPGFKTLARRMGMSMTAARGHARKLEVKRYLRREKRVGTTNRFHLEPLFEALEKLRSADRKRAKKASA